MKRKIASRSNVFPNKQKKLYVIGGSILIVVLVAFSLFYEHKQATLNVNNASPAQKQRLVSIQQTRETLRPTRVPLSVLQTRFHTTPEPTPQAGIFATHQGPFEPITFIINNAWQGSVGNNWEIVFAGGVPQDPQSGNSLPVYAAVRIYRGKRTPYGVGSLVGVFVVPDKSSSPLTITAVNGTVLQLKANSGQMFTFDLLTNRYQ